MSFAASWFGHNMNCEAEGYMKASLAATGRYVETCRYVTGGQVSGADSCFGHSMNCAAE